MEIQFTYTPEDLQEALTVKWPRSTTSRRSWVSPLLFFAWLATMIYLVVVRGLWRQWKLDLLQVWHERSFEQLVGIFMPGFVAIVFSGSFIWLYFRNRAQKGRRLWNSSPAIQQPQTVVVDGDGLKFNSPLVDSLFRWPMMQFWNETTNLFVVQLTTKAFLIIPKRATSGDELDRLRETFGEKIVPPAKGFPIASGGTSL